MGRLHITLNHFKCFVCGQWGKPEHAYLGKNLSEKNRELINSIHMIPNPQIKFGIQWYNQTTSCGCQLLKIYRALLDNCLNNNHLSLSGWSKPGNIMAYGGFFLSDWVAGGVAKPWKWVAKLIRSDRKILNLIWEVFFLPCPPNQITEIQMMGPTYHLVDMQQKEVLKLHGTWTH